MRYIEYNLNYTFNNQLRDVPESPKDVEKYILSAKRKLKKIKDPKERVSLLGQLGSFLRMLEKLDDAEKYLEEALGLISDHDLGVKLWVSNGIRMAHVYQWMEAFDIAEEMFHGIVEVCEVNKEASEYLNYALQHFGKLYFDIGEYDEALECFNNALELRKQINDKSLIEGTQHAIKITKEKI